MSKTHKSTLKRIKVTKKGKVTRNKQMMKNNSHLKNKRKSARKIYKDKLALSSKKQIKKIKLLINA